MASYNNIEDILKQFELQIVQALHYKKSETFTKTEIQTLINTAIAGVNQFGVVKCTQASNTPYGVTFTPTGGTAITGSLTAANADSHTVYFVPSTNGTDDVFDEYMAINGAWEKIGNTDVNLTNYVQKTTTVNGHALSGNVTVTKGDVGLGNVTNVATENTITQNSTNNITSGAVYTEVNKAVSSSSHGVALGGKVNAPTITVTLGSVANNDQNLVTGNQVYAYAQPKDADLSAIAEVTGSGFLKRSSGGVWSLNTTDYQAASYYLNLMHNTLTNKNEEEITAVKRGFLRFSFLPNNSPTCAFVEDDFVTETYLSTYLENYADDTLDDRYVNATELTISDSDFTTMLSELNS